MKVTLIDCTEDPEMKIAIAAATCYNSDALDCESNKVRVRKLMEWKHHSTLRFANATFSIQDISRICSHQIVRTAHAGFLQRSQRYVDCSDITVVHPPKSNNLPEELCFEIERLEWLSSKVYNAAIANGMAKEDARYYLLQGCTTELVMTGNFQMWHGWLKARTSKKAQWEIREVAKTIAKELKNVAPIIFAEF